MNTKNKAKYRYLNGTLVRISKHKSGVCMVYNLTHSVLDKRIVVLVRGETSDIRYLEGDGRTVKCHHRVSVPTRSMPHVVRSLEAKYKTEPASFSI